MIRVDEPDFRLLVGHADDVLATLPDGSVDCIVTSPPYWNLRDYGTGEWEGGDPACDHARPTTNYNEGFNDRWGQGSGQRKQEAKSAGQYGGACPRCGAVRVDDQLGLEPVHDCYGWATGDRCGACYVDKLTATLREARRVLSRRGTLWLNLGDSYASKARGSDEGWDKSRLENPGGAQKAQAAALRRNGQRHRGKDAGLKEKDLAGVPWSVAMSLRADGWWLRADAIWCLSGGTRLYARTPKGDGPAMLKDLARLDPATVELWNGERWTRVVGWHRAEARGEPLEVELASGERIGCTPGHVWPTQRGNVRADELVPGDVIATTRLPARPCPDRPRLLPDDEVGWLVGRYLADGSVSGDCVQIACHADEAHALAARAGHLAAALHGSDSTYVDGNKATVNLRGPLILPLIRAYIHGRDARTKGLRARAWRRSDDFLMGVLTGYLEGDGHYENGRWKLGFTRNDRLAGDLRTIAARLGLPLRLVAAAGTGFGRRWPIYRGQLRVEPSTRANDVAAYGRVGEVRRSRARQFWDVEVADEPHLFALASGVLTHNSKPNPMPESTEDRPVKAHEYVFVLARSRRYWYDRVAVLEPLAAATVGDGRLGRAAPAKGDATPYGQQVAKAAGLGHGPRGSMEGRNMRSTWEEAQALEEHERASWLAAVFLDAMQAGREGLAGTAWRIATEKFPGAHFATFPTRLAERAILAGCPAEVCRTCGLPRERLVESETSHESGSGRSGHPPAGKHGDRPQEGTGDVRLGPTVTVTTLGWTDCGHGDYRPGVVLDPFLGSGTTAVAARRLGRHAVGVELSEEYADLAAERVGRWWRPPPAPPPGPDEDQLALTLA